MLRTLVVVYSHTGTASRLADLLCSQMNWNRADIHDVRSRTGVLGTLRCVADSLLELSPPIRYEGPDPAAFEQVVLIAPIWLFQMAGPMRSFVAQHRRGLREVGVIAVMGGEGGPNAASEIAHQIGRAPLLSTSFTTREVQTGACAEALYSFGRALSDMSRTATSPPTSLNDWAQALA